MTQEIENNAYANFWGVKEVYYGICKSREYKRKSSDLLHQCFKTKSIFLTWICMFKASIQGNLKAIGIHSSSR